MADDHKGDAPPARAARRKARTATLLGVMAPTLEPVPGTGEPAAPAIQPPRPQIKAPVVQPPRAKGAIPRGVFGAGKPLPKRKAPISSKLFPARSPKPAAPAPAQAKKPDDPMASTLRTESPVLESSEDLPGESTNVVATALEPATDLPGEPTHVVAAELAGEPTHAAPRDPLPAEAKLAAEAAVAETPVAETPVAETPVAETPAAQATEAPIMEEPLVVLEASYDPPTSTGPTDLPVVPTVMVDQAALQPAQTYSLDLDSGQLEVRAEIARTPTHVGAPPKKSRRGLVIAIAATVGMFMAAIAVAVVWVMIGSEPEASPIAAAPTEATEAEATEAEATEAEATEAEATEAETAEAETAEAETAEAETAEAETAEGDDAEPEAAPAAAGSSTVEELQGFDLELPRTSRRVRRMSERTRRQHAGRLRGRALQAYRSGEHAEAERLFREALGFNDWDVAAIEGMARAIAQQDRHAEALAWARLARSRNPRSATPHRILGDIWRQAGHPDQARRAYQRGLRRHPRDRHLRQRVADLRAGR